MNGLLQLKGQFEKRGNESMGPTCLPAHQKVTVMHMEQLITQLLKVKEYWIDNNDIAGAIVSVHYIRVVAKSNRLKNLLGDVGKKPTDSIRGAKFVTEKNEQGKTIHKHVFTHYVQMSAIDRTIDNLRIVQEIVREDYSGCISSEDVKKLGKEKKYLYADKIAKTNFINIIVDCYFVEKFDVDEVKESITEDSIITIYRTNIDTRTLLSKFGIDVLESRIIGGTTNIHYVVSKDTINEAITRLEMDSFPKGVNAVIFILYKPVGNGIIEKVLKNTDSRIERFISLATKVKHPYRVGFDTCFTPALLRWGDTVPAVSIDACEAATFSMYIDSQMNCYPCSFGIWDKSISESMNSKALREIWQGDKFVAFREQRKEKCSSCRQTELCRGGCRLGIDIDMC